MKKKALIMTLAMVLLVGASAGTVAGLTKGFTDWSFGRKETVDNTPRRLNMVMVDFSSKKEAQFNVSLNTNAEEEPYMHKAFNYYDDSDDEVFSGYEKELGKDRLDGFVEIERNVSISNKNLCLGSQLVLDGGSTNGELSLTLADGYVFDRAEIYGRPQYADVRSGISLNGSGTYLFGCEKDESGEVEYCRASFSFANTQNVLHLKSRNFVQIRSISFWVQEKTS